MERREQVFISSTYIDLVEERQEVIQTLLEADCIPAGMELFPASDDDRWTLIQRVIDDCDYYVIVIGGRYGSIDPDQGISYTEMEFDYAVSRGMPVLAFVHGDAQNIPVSKTDQKDGAREQLETFRDKVCQRVVKFWTTPQELGGQVAKSLIQARKTHPAEGWVRARNAMTPEVRQELAELRARVAELSADLAAEQVHAPVVAPEALARGTDAVTLEGIVTYWPREVVKADEMYQRTRKRGRYPVDSKWDDIFAALGPSMLDESRESDLEDVLAQHMTALARNEDEAREDEKQIGWFISYDVDHKSFDDVRVQLFSLGLIERSERRRQISDTHTYWTLTPAGRDHLMRLRAIRRPAPEADHPIEPSTPDGEGVADQVALD